MMTTVNNILVIGATQGTGALIVEKLATQGAKVSILARNPAKAEARFPGVPVLVGDVTKLASLTHDLSVFEAVILTVGVTKRPAGEVLVRETEYRGTVNVLNALKRAGFDGRLLYMNSIGTARRTWLSMTLNLVKGKTLIWRRQAETAIRASGLRYTIIRAGILNDQPAGVHQLRIVPGHLPLTLGNQVSRADMADVFVEALTHEGTVNMAFNVVWKARGTRQPLPSLLDYATSGKS